MNEKRVIYSTVIVVFISLVVFIFYFSLYTPKTSIRTIVFQNTGLYTKTQIGLSRTGCRIETTSCFISKDSLKFITGNGTVLRYRLIGESSQFLYVEFRDEPLVIRKRKLTQGEGWLFSFRVSDSDIVVLSTTNLCNQK